MKQISTKTIFHLTFSIYILFKGVYVFSFSNRIIFTTLLERITTKRNNDLTSHLISL